MTDIEEVFSWAPSPYGHPVISFASDSGDSTIYMTPGHHPLTRRIIATFNWLLRYDAIIFLNDRGPTEFLEWGFANFEEESVPDEEFDVAFTRYKVILNTLNGEPVTFVEV